MTYATMEGPRRWRARARPNRWVKNGPEGAKGLGPGMFDVTFSFHAEHEHAEIYIPYAARARLDFLSNRRK